VITRPEEPRVCHSYYVAEYGHSILRFTFISSLDTLFGRKTVSNNESKNIFKVLPIPILLEYIIMSVSVEDFLNLSSIDTYLRTFCQKYDEDIWKHFLLRDFTIASLTDDHRSLSFSTYKGAYQCYRNFLVLNIYEYPLIISGDYGAIHSTISGVPGYNSHGFFLKKNGKKYKSAEIMLNTNVGYYYSIHSKHIDLTDWKNRLVDDDNSEEDLEEMIEFLLNEGYSGIIGAVLNGKIKYIWEMSKDEYRSIKIHIDHMYSPNTRQLKRALQQKYF
jgi:hypothetical protein